MVETAAHSDEQELAISFGLRKGEKSWRRVGTAAMRGRAHCPDWARDLHVNWRDGYGNFPELQLRLYYNPLLRGGVTAAEVKDLQPRWYKRGEELYIGTAEGMASIHYHSGAVAERELPVFGGYETDAEGKTDFSKPIHSTRTALCTTKQDGYGGRTFPIRMAEDSDFYPGRVIELRGPWHSGAPEGFLEVHCHVDNAARDARTREWRRRPSMAHLGPDRCKWWNLGLTFGWYVEQATFFAIAAELRPELEFALVEHGNWLRLEPIDPRTGCPKGFTPEQEVKA